MKPTEPSRIEATPPTPETTSFIGLLLRLFWMAFGGVGLYLCALKLMLGDPQNRILLTACLFLVAALMIAARYADIRFFKGETGAPATMTHFRAYALRTAVLASALYTGSIVLGEVFRT